jgi:hypothetical protein
VADHRQFQNGNLQWNIFFTKPVHNWEMEVASYFPQSKARRGEDRVFWIPSKRGKFEVKSHYHELSISVNFPFP